MINTNHVLARASEEVFRQPDPRGWRPADEPTGGTRGYGLGRSWARGSRPQPLLERRDGLRLTDLRARPGRRASSMAIYTIVVSWQDELGESCKPATTMPQLSGRLSTLGRRCLRRLPARSPYYLGHFGEVLLCLRDPLGSYPMFYATTVRGYWCPVRLVLIGQTQVSAQLTAHRGRSPA